MAGPNHLKSSGPEPADATGSFLVSVLVFGILLTWLVREFSRALLPLFPAGNNSKADLLHRTADFSQPVLVVLAAALLFILASVTHGPRRRLVVGGATLVLSVAVLTGAMWLPLVLLVSPLLAQGQSPKQMSLFTEASKRLLTGGPFVVFTSALLLVTFSINMNYYLPGQGIWYLLSLCTFISIVSFCILSLLITLCRLVNEKIVWGGRLTWLVGLSVGLGGLLHEHILSFSEKLNLANVSQVIPAALAVVIFVLFGDQLIDVRKSWETPHFKKALIGRLIVLGVTLNIGYRYIYTGDKDLILDVVQDVLFIMTCGMMTLAMLSVWSLQATEKRHTRWVSLVSAVGILVALTAFFLYSHKTWTYEIEGNRAFSRFVSSTVRGLLLVVGVSDQRDVAHKEALVLAASANTRPLPSRFWLGSDRPIVRPGDRPPHIFIFVSDATTSTRMGVYGYQRDNTPHLNEFAKEALLYRHFYSASSATFQGVVAMFSGAYGGRRAGLSDEVRVRLCTGLHEKGYRLLLAGIGYDMFETGKRCAPAGKLSAEGYLLSDYDQIKQSLAEYPDQPHFVYQHVNGGHNPWQVAPEDEIYGQGKPDIYDAMLRVSDRQFGELIAFLKAEGIYDNSIVIFTADHGIGLGFHMDKSSYSNLYAQNTDVPFLLKIPGVPAREITGHYTHVDLLPGFAEILGFGIDGPIAGYGLGLSPVSDSIKDRCIFSIAEYKNMVAMNCQAGKKLIWNVDEKILYIYGADDPLETRNLIVDYGDQEVLELAQPLLEFMAGGRGTYIQ